MEKAEIQQISDFLYDVYEGLCEGDEPVRSTSRGKAGQRRIFWWIEFCRDAQPFL